MPNYITNCFSPVPVYRRYPDRERFLFPVEWERVRLVLATEPLKIRVYFYVLLMTGARMSEVRLMQWRHVDLAAGLWYKPVTKGGRSQVLPVSPSMASLLESLPRDTRYCFHGDLENNNVNPDGPWSRRVIFYHWQRIRKAANVEDVRIHDLRRTCASWLTMYGENLPVVKYILDHRNIQTTMIYARLDAQAVREALQRHAKRVIG